MKRKTILLSVLSLLIATAAFSQTGEARANWAVGFSGGAAINNVTFAPRIKQAQLITPTGGFTIRYISEKYFAMICGTQLEVNFSQRGWKEDMEEKPGAYHRKMNYVDIPFLMHLAFGKERGARFFINAGPQISFLLNETENMIAPLSGEQYGKLAEKKFDYGIAGGGGLEIRTKAGNFLLEGRYYFGLGDFYNSTKKDYFERSAHTTISAKVTYLFDLHK